MRIIEESQDHGYQVAYSFNDNLVKVVKSNYKKNFVANISCLQIQRPGLDMFIEELKFINGLPETYQNTTHINDGVISPLTSPKQLEEILKRFGEEFKSLFYQNRKLQEALPKSFSALMPYLK